MTGDRFKTEREERERESHDWIVKTNKKKAKLMDRPITVKK